MTRSAVRSRLAPPSTSLWADSLFPDAIASFTLIEISTGHTCVTVGFCMATIRKRGDKWQVQIRRAEDFAAYRDERLRTIKPLSLKRELAPIHHLFEIARDEWGLPIRENPLDKLQLKAPDQRRERRLREGELDRLLYAAGSCRNRLVGSIIQFALETGMRRGEILAISKNHIDFDRRALLITDTKNGQSRTIPLTSAAIALLHSCRRDQDRVFPITGNAFRLAWERVKRKAGIDDLHFHDLRHEAISRFFEIGLTTPEVALISGHRDMRMLFRYSHAARETILEKFSRHTT
jgi:integrase